MVEENTTQLLIERAKDGDRGAFEKLCGQFELRLRAFLKTRVKFYLGPTLDLDDLAQETLVRAYQSIDRFDWRGEESFPRWLFGIGKNVTLKAVEKTKKSEELENASRVEASGTSPSQLLRRNERFDRLKKSVESLPADYREVVLLARVEGLKIKEIAERLERTPNAVKHLLARALTQLRENFGDTESLHLPDRRIKEEGEIDDEA